MPTELRPFLRRESFKSIIMRTFHQPRKNMFILIGVGSWLNVNEKSSAAVRIRISVDNFPVLTVIVRRACIAFQQRREKKISPKRFRCVAVCCAWAYDEQRTEA